MHWYLSTTPDLILYFHRDCLQKSFESDARNIMNNDLVKKAALIDGATLAAQLQTSLSQGLAQQEAQDRLQKYGPNQLPQEHKWWLWTLWDQFQSPFIYLLLLICGLMVFLGDTTNALITLAIVALNTVVGFYQEYKAAQTFAALQKLMVLRSTVIRNGVEKNIPTSELVPGDLIVLYPGDIIPADARLIEQEQLLINESSLTGESLPITKQTSSLSAMKESARPSNIVFTGTTVISGKGQALVVATGVGTSLGEIVRLVTEETPPSPFAKGIANISRFMVFLTAGTIALLIIAHLLIMPNKLNI
jgi:magnesium-transporting ATPase (P-type)